MLIHSMRAHTHTHQHMYHMIITSAQPKHNLAMVPQKKKKSYRLWMSFCHFTSHYWPAERGRQWETWHLSSMSVSLLDLPQLRSSYFLAFLSLALLCCFTILSPILKFSFKSKYVFIYMCVNHVCIPIPMSIYCIIYILFLDCYTYFVLQALCFSTFNIKDNNTVCRYILHSTVLALFD